MCYRLLSALIVAAFFGLAASSAQAARVHAVTTYEPLCFCSTVAVTFTGLPGESNHVTVTHSQDPVDLILDTAFPVLQRPRGTGSYRIVDTTPMTVTGEGCTADTLYVALCGAGDGLSGNLGDRNDSLDTTATVSFSGGTGDDRLSGAGFLTGADGNDTVLGSGLLRGGNGDDRIVATSGTISCGSGTDVAVGGRQDADCETQVRLP